SKIKQELGFDVQSHRSVDADLLKTSIAKSTLQILNKAFTSIDFVKLSMNRLNDTEDFLTIPFIGGATELIMEDYTKSLDNFVLETSMQRGYIPFARAMNSSAGRRSGLMGVYVTTDVMI